MSSIADIDFIWRESATTLNSNFARQISCIAAFCRRKCRTIAKNTKKLFRAANRGNIGCSRLFLEREVGEGSIDILLLGLEILQEKKNPAMKTIPTSWAQLQTILPVALPKIFMFQNHGINNMPKFYCDYCDTYLTHNTPR